MQKVSIEKSTLDFLKTLSRNNDREWFQKNKEKYLASQANVISWLDQLIAEMNKHDQLQTQNGKEALYRIYNDVRFSADKTPYNPRFAGSLKRVKPFLRGGYYFWIKPGESRVGCGFTYPNSEDLRRIREDISINYADWNRLLRHKKIVNTFGEMSGEQVKTAPRGFDKDHPAIELLRFKQFWVEHSFTDKEVLAPDFLKKVNDAYKNIRPFFDYMTEVLTTDLNGVSII
jgi:TIGR02453 family protein